MIDPFKITNYQRTRAELEEFLLFCIVAAGKNAVQQARKLDDLLQPHLVDMERVFNSILDDEPPRPLEVIDFLAQSDRLFKELQRVRLGQYRRVFTAFLGVMQLSEYAKQDLATVPIARLELIGGIGPKTARFFALHTREGARHAVLDTHVLRWLRQHGYNAPKTTPPAGLRYDNLEAAFLTECDQRGVNPADLDLAIWTEFTKNKQEAA